MLAPSHGCWRAVSAFLVVHISFWDLDASLAGGTDHEVVKESISGIPVFSQSQGDVELDWVVLRELRESSASMHDFHDLILAQNMVPRGKIQMQNHAGQTRIRQSIGQCIVRGSKQQLGTVLRAAVARGINISMVQEDIEFTLSSVTEPHLRSWGLDRIDNRTGLDHSYTPGVPNRGAGVHVYIIDTGVRATHADFGGRVVPSLDASPLPESNGWVCNPSNFTCTEDPNGHGTHVAGIAIGSTFGVASQAIGHAVKAIRIDKQGSVAGLVTALDWIRENGQVPAIVSLSIGLGKRVPAVDVSVERLTSAGVVVIAAAGNQNTSACDISPGATASVLTVGATDSCDVKPAFSNMGSCVDIFAPGVDIPSADRSSDTAFSFRSGTSQACPFVTGAAALLLAERPSLDVNETVNLLLASSTCGRIRDIDAETPNRLLFVGSGFPVRNQSSSCLEIEGFADLACKHLPASSTYPETQTSATESVGPGYARFFLSLLCLAVPLS